MAKLTKEYYSLDHKKNGDTALEAAESSDPPAKKTKLTVLESSDEDESSSEVWVVFESKI